MCDHCGCRHVGPTAELTGEHDEILRLGWQIVRAEEARRPIDEELFVSLVDLHLRHSRKEELGLFRLVLETGDCSPEQIEGLEREHREQTDLLASRSFDRDAYYALAAHVETEEYEIFPMAMFGFDDKLWDEMDAAHRSVDPEVPSGSRSGHSPGEDRPLIT